ncbi:Eco57I restriction-modification methylase domain-containing protein [Glaesserella parasuis]|uniref:Eco57I restriction-modification methylase domain-containing protein n=1 Tax=Glaesserella parasuis TaxID=738 RepID=UPI001659D1CA|nr:N-6 DNA methylase [Glaesserella parasuis]
MEEWQVLFRLSESDKGQNQDIEKRRKKLSEIFSDNINNNEKEYLALYVLQTSYAIIVKLIACKVIQTLSFSEDVKFFSDLSIIDSIKLQRFMEKLEDGYVFSSGGIRNLLEGDFYSWYSDKNQWNSKIYNSIKNIIKELEFYSSSNFSYEFQTIDIFKDLYMEIMPNEIRHSLGEYFTPSWMADHVVSRSLEKLNKESWKAIDPCCGSGVFLISLIKSILDKHELYSLTIKEKQELLLRILSSVYGIDLNPLSVLTARVSYFLAIRPLIDEQKIEIPVYLGDSANIPQKIELDNIACYTYTVETKQGDFNIIFPCNFVESSSFFERMYRLQTTVEAEDPKLLYHQIIENIDKDSINNKIKQSIKILSSKLVELHKNEWDGIWIRITSNFMLIARVKEMDLILGNPPWVKWEFLPQNYAEKIKSLCIDRKLFSGQSYMGAISLNLCALIANVTSDKWLTNKGLLAFLMPKTIMTQDSYAGFRNFYLSDGSRMYLSEIDDWSNAGNPFIVTTEKFMTYFYGKNSVDYSNGVPINLFYKKSNVKITEVNRFHAFEKVKDFFQIKDGMAYQLSENRTGFTLLPERDYTILRKLKLISGTSDYKARSGVEFTPAEVYFIEPEKRTSKNTFYFRNSEFKNSVYKVAKN